jgi:phosphatidylglycerophosphate synthase
MTAAAAPSRPQARLKARDAAWTVSVVDPLATPLVARLASVRAITPNRLTTASALVAIGAGVAFAFDQLIVGAIVYQLSFLLDCMDGKLAKLRGGSNPLGGWFDVIGDTVRLIACSIGLMIALANDQAAAAPLLMAYVALRFGVLAVAEAREAPGRSEMISVAPRYLAVLRLARRRAALPGTTVDVEAIVFTLGPIAGLPVVAVGIGAAVELAHLSMYVIQAVRAERDRTRAA